MGEERHKYPRYHDNTFLKHSFIMLLLLLVAGIFNYGYHILLLKFLGPGEYSVIFSLISIYMIITLPAGTIQTGVSRYISKHMVNGSKEGMRKLIFSAFFTMAKFVSLGLLVYIVLISSIKAYLHLTDWIPVLLIGLSIWLGLILPIGYGVIQGIQRFSTLGGFYILGAFLRFSIGLSLVYLGYNVRGAIFSGFISNLSLFLLLFYLIKKEFRRSNEVSEEIPNGIDNKGKSFISTKEFWSYMIPVGVSYLCFSFMTYIDGVIVKHYFNELYAGYYSTVALVGKIFLFVPMAFTSVMFPKVSVLYDMSFSTRMLLKKTILYSGIVCTIGILLCILFPKEIIGLLLHKEYHTIEAFTTTFPLMYMIGFAITPYGVLCILINYYLAKHRYGFIPYLICGGAVQFTLLLLFHTTLQQVLWMVLLGGIITISLLWIFHILRTSTQWIIVGDEKGKRYWEVRNEKTCYRYYYRGCSRYWT